MPPKSSKSTEWNKGGRDKELFNYRKQIFSRITCPKRLRKVLRLIARGTPVLPLPGTLLSDVLERPNDEVSSAIFVSLLTTSSGSPLSLKQHLSLLTLVTRSFLWEQIFLILRAGLKIIEILCDKVIWLKAMVMMAICWFAVQNGDKLDKHGDEHHD